MNLQEWVLAYETTQGAVDQLEQPWLSALGRAGCQPCVSHSSTGPQFLHIEGSQGCSSTVCAWLLWDSNPFVQMPKLFLLCG